MGFSFVLLYQWFVEKKMIDPEIKQEDFIQKGLNGYNATLFMRLYDRIRFLEEKLYGENKDQFTPMSFEEWEKTEFAEDLNKHHGFILADVYWEETKKYGQTSMEDVAGINSGDSPTVMYEKYVLYLKKLRTLAPKKQNPS